MDFVRAAQAEDATVHALGLAALVLERFGFGKRFSAPLSAVARRAAQRLGLRVRGIVMPPAQGIDAIPFFHRGLDCLTISSGSLGPATYAIHSAGDTFDKLDGRSLAEAAALATEMARELGSDQAPTGLRPRGQG